MDVHDPIAGVIIPIRSFTNGLTRLAPRLTPEERSVLLRTCATRVVRATHSLSTVVVSSAPEVIDWAASLGVKVLPDPGSINDAAHAGQEYWQAQGVGRIIVVHADLPRIETLEPLIRYAHLPVATLVPCHRNDGTPVLSIPSDVAFSFAYGPGSFHAHVDAGRRAGLAVHVIRTPELRFDIDLPADVDALESIQKLDLLLHRRTDCADAKSPTITSAQT
ncbi:MAG: 2-phospho-L-lactate guanylyltransferase [Acidimicrobiia bacterium]